MALAGVGLLVGLAACEGRTSPAENIGATSAYLALTGTANNGPAYSYFEYWKTADGIAAKKTTPTKTWQAGATGPYTERVINLSKSTPYTFRACGGDAGDTAYCQPTRTFTTTASNSTVVKFGNALVFQGDPGFAQNVYVSESTINGVVRFEFSENSGNTIEPNSACPSVRGDLNNYRVTCAAAGITKITLDLRDGDDSGQIATNRVPAEINGGLGADSLYGSENADYLIGGAGVDIFSAAGGNDKIHARNGDLESNISCGEGPGDTDLDTAYVDSNGELPVPGSDENCEHVFLTAPPATP